MNQLKLNSKIFPLNFQINYLNKASQDSSIQLSQIIIKMRLQKLLLVDPLILILALVHTYLKNIYSYLITPMLNHF